MTRDELVVQLIDAQLEDDNVHLDLPWSPELPGLLESLGYTQMPNIGGRRLGKRTHGDKILYWPPNSGPFVFVGPEPR